MSPGRSENRRSTISAPDSLARAEPPWASSSLRLPFRRPGSHQGRRGAPFVSFPPGSPRDTSGGGGRDGAAGGGWGPPPPAPGSRGGGVPWRRGTRGLGGSAAARSDLDRAARRPEDRVLQDHRGREHQPARQDRSHPDAAGDAKNTSVSSAPRFTASSNWFHSRRTSRDAISFITIPRGPASDTGWIPVQVQTLRPRRWEGWRSGDPEASLDPGAVGCPPSRSCCLASVRSSMRTLSSPRAPSRALDYRRFRPRSSSCSCSQAPTPTARGRGGRMDQATGGRVLDGSAAGSLRDGIPPPARHPGRDRLDQLLELRTELRPQAPDVHVHGPAFRRRSRIPRPPHQPGPGGDAPGVFGRRYHQGSNSLYVSDLHARRRSRGTCPFRA